MSQEIFKNPIDQASQMKQRGGYYDDSFGRSNWYENEQQIMDDYRKGWLKKKRAIEIAADLQLPDLVFEDENYDSFTMQNEPEDLEKLENEWGWK